MSNRPPRWLIALIVLISLPLLLPFLYVIERAADVGLARSIELLWRPRMWELLSNTLLLMVFVTLFASERLTSSKERSSLFKVAATGR